MFLREEEMPIFVGIIVVAVITFIAMFTPTSVFSKGLLTNHLVVNVGEYNFNFEGDYLGLVDETLMNDSNTRLVAQVAWGEQRKAHTGGILGMRATTELIHNRKESDRFPNTIMGVVFQKAAFSSIDPKTFEAKGIKSIYYDKAEAAAYAEALVIAMQYQTAVNNGWPAPFNHANGAVLTYTPDAMCSHVKDRECLPSDLVPDWNFDLLIETANVKGSLYFAYK